jgi:hypothetical protein
MKKISILIAATMICCITISHKLIAQTKLAGYAFNSPHYSTATDQAMFSNGYSPDKSINLKAIKSFKKVYAGATSAEWSVLKDNGFVCRFYLLGVLNAAHYGSNGHWLYSIATYEESNLSPSIRNIVKSVYYDFSITCINEITAPGNPTVYLVQVQDKQSLQILSIRNDEMELLQEFKK